jgi:hypothetical protein
MMIGNDHDDYDDDHNDDDHNDGDHNDDDYDACICAYLSFIATADNDNYFETAYRLAGKRSLPFSSSSRLTSSDSDVDGSSSSSYQGMYCIISTVTIYHSSLLNNVNLSP